MRLRSGGFQLYALQVITDMIGVDDEEMRGQLVELTTQLVAFGDPGIREGVDMFELFATTIFRLHAAGYNTRPAEGQARRRLGDRADGRRGGRRAVDR